jgi:hypothetical protein
MKFGNVEIRAFGPHGFPLNDPAGFGLAQITAHLPAIERIDCRNPAPSGVGQGKLFDNAVSGERISSFQGGDLQSNPEQFSLNGWSRCYQNKEIWFSLNAAAHPQAVRLDIRWAGLKSSPLSEKPSAATYALVFYIKAAACALEDGSMLYPKGLHRYQGKCQKIVFDKTMQIECSQIMNVQVIPLAGFGCFWNATFLVAFEFNPSQDQASFVLKCDGF